MMVKKDSSNSGFQQRARSAEEEAKLKAEGFELVAPEPQAPEPVTAAVELDDMTKVELLQFAENKGIEVNQYASKKELLAEIKEKLQ